MRAFSSTPSGVFTDYFLLWHDTTVMSNRLVTLEGEAFVSSRKAEMSNPRQNRIQNHKHFPTIQQTSHLPTINNDSFKITSNNVSTA